MCFVGNKKGDVSFCFNTSPVKVILLNGLFHVQIDVDELGDVFHSNLSIAVKVADSRVVVGDNAQIYVYQERDVTVMAPSPSRSPKRGCS